MSQIILSSFWGFPSMSGAPILLPPATGVSDIKGLADEDIAFWGVSLCALCMETAKFYSSMIARTSS